jgi:hypothetical protein
MQINACLRSWQLWCAATVMSVVCGSPIEARASCVGGPARIVWSYPADGDRGVPLDAEIRVITTATLRNLYSATLNDTAIDLTAEGVYIPDGLEPDTDYTFRIVGPKPRSSMEPTSTLFELTFHTSSELASEAPAPQLLGSTHANSVPTLEELCMAAYNAGECFDTPRYVYYNLELEPQEAVAWLVTTPGSSVGKLWPSECNPVLTLHESQDSEPRCVELQALSANGALSEPTKYCTGEEGMKASAQTASSEQASTGMSSCAVATLSEQRKLGGCASALWLAAVALYFVPRRRSSRRHNVRSLRL